MRFRLLEWSWSIFEWSGSCLGIGAGFNLESSSSVRGSGSGDGLCNSPRAVLDVSRVAFEWS